MVGLEVLEGFADSLKVGVIRLSVFLLDIDEIFQELCLHILKSFQITNFNKIINPYQKN